MIVTLFPIITLSIKPFNLKAFSPISFTGSPLYVSGIIILVSVTVPIPTTE